MPWAQLLQTAVLRLGLNPAAFWQMSLAEWNMIARVNAPLTRDDLDALLARYPDTKT